MKILILAQSRSGSTSLFQAIRRTIKIPVLYEPFCPAKRKTQSSLQQDLDAIIHHRDLLVKIVDNHFYRCDLLKDYLALTKYFDKIVGLTRENDKDNAKSYLIASMTRNWLDYTKKPSIEQQILDKNWDLFTLYLANSQKHRQQILSFDIFQVTYEGLYIRKDQIADLAEYLGFNIDLITNHN